MLYTLMPGTIIDWYEEVYHLQNKLLSLADFMIGIFAVYALILFGFFSDRSKSRFGKRKPFIVLLAPILAISVGALYNPGLDGGRSDLIANWFVICCFVMQVRDHCQELNNKRAGVHYSVNGAIVWTCSFVNFEF